jgi:hypothetical protein
MMDTTFSYLNNSYLHRTMELPTAQEKSNQIFFALLKVHQYKFRDEQDWSAPFTLPKSEEHVTENSCVPPGVFVPLLTIRKNVEIMVIVR